MPWHCAGACSTSGLSCSRSPPARQASRGVLHAGVSGHAHKNWGSDVAARAIFVRVLGLIMMTLSILMTLYAAYNFRLRGEMLLCALLLSWLPYMCLHVRCCLGQLLVHTADMQRPSACSMKMDGPYDNRVLPVGLSGIMIVALTIVFGGAVVQFTSSS